MRLEFDGDEGFYVDTDTVDSDGLHPEVLLPDDVNEEIERLRARVEELEECGTKSHGIFSEAMEQVESERDTLKARVEELERAIETWKDEEQHWKATEMGFLATVNTCPIAYDILMSVARAGRLVVEAAESDSQNTSESDSERVWSRVDDLDEALERVTWVNWEADNE